MQKQILSTIVHIQKPEIINTKVIEDLLHSQYGELIRWAIIGSTDNKFKISITCEKDA